MTATTASVRSACRVIRTTASMQRSAAASAGMRDSTMRAGRSWMSARHATQPTTPTRSSPSITSVAPCLNDRSRLSPSTGLRRSNLNSRMSSRTSRRVCASPMSPAANAAAIAEGAAIAMSVPPIIESTRSPPMRPSAPRSP